MEAILAQQKAGDLANYNVVVAKLGKEVIRQVANILANPPEKDKYKTLKNKLLEIYEESETRQIQKLMSEMELGDQRPSHLLRRMRELAKDRVTDDALAILWRSHLPPSVSGVLAVTTAMDLDGQAAVADRVMETYKPMQIAGVSSTPALTSSGVINTVSSVSTLDIATIMAEIAKINLRINALDYGRGRTAWRGRGARGRSMSRSRSRPRRNEQSPDWLCFYHHKYKTKAAKCVQPCNWKTNSTKTEN